MPSMDAALLEKVLVPLEYLALMMPMTSPYWLNRGPPELPELTVQSVWSSVHGGAVTHGDGHGPWR